MKNILFILFCIVVASTSLLYATDPFIIGTYQEMNNFNNGAQATIDTLFDRMNAAKYNLVVLEREDSLQSFIAGSNHVNNAVKIVPHLQLSNGYFFEDKYHYAFLPFEAEYFKNTDISDVIGTLPYEQRWYTCDLNDSFDSVVNTDNASNGAYMHCNVTGSNRPRNVMEVHKNYWNTSSAYYQDFSYYKIDSTNGDSTYNVVMRLKIKANCAGYSENEWLCGINAKIGYGNSWFNVSYQIQDVDWCNGFNPVIDTANNMYVITKSIYDANTTNIDANGFKYFDFIIKRNHIPSTVYLNKREMYLYPIVRYYDMIPMNIDCVELMNKGSIEYNSADSTSKINDINNAIQNCLQNSSPAIGGYTELDEPMHAQFPILDRVISKLKNSNAQYYRSVYNPYVFTLLYHTLGNGNMALLNKYFIDKSHPQQILPQFYCVIIPGLSQASYDCSDDATVVDGTGSEYHFQTMLTQMCMSYEQHRAYCTEKGVKFLPIIQSYGHIDSLRWSGWMLPPTATMKALCYLPLCYQPDGIFYYSFSGFGKTGDQLSQVALVNQYNPGDPIEYTSQYYAVKEANKKISVIGPMIRNMAKERNFLLKTQTESISLHNDLPSATVHVTDGIAVNDTIHGAYIGFIQGAKFLSSDNADYLMLVNRRANRFIDSLFVDNPGDQHSDNYFATIRPQNVVLQFPSTMSKIPCVVDVYTNKIYHINKDFQIIVSMPAGEGMLLKIVEDTNVIYKVNHDQTGCFSTIQDAVWFASILSTYHPHISQTIEIDAGTYREAVNITALSGTLTITSTAQDSSNTIIGGIVDSLNTYCFMVTQTDSLNLNFSYLKMRYAHKGIYVAEDNLRQQPINVQNCVFRDITDNVPTGASLPLHWGAITTNSIPINVKNCSFIDNRISWTINHGSNGEFSRGAAIHEVIPSGTVNIENNIFLRNYARDGAATFLSGDTSTKLPVFVVKNNQYLYNVTISNDCNTTCYNLDSSGGNNGRGSAVHAEYANSITMKDNIFFHNEIDSVRTCCVVYGDNVLTTICNNNTFANNYATPISVSGATSSLRIKNNILYHNRNAHVNYPDYLLCLSSNEANYKVYNNLYYENTKSTIGSGTQFANNIAADPKMNLANSSSPFTLKWTATEKSPCIDNGDADTNGDGTNWATDVNDQDTDGTRKDIGAKVAMTHDNYVTTLQAASIGLKSTYNWICFPYMDKLYNSGSPETNEYIFHTYHGNNLLVTQPSVLNTIQWNYNTDAGIVEHRTPGWTNTSNSVISQKGYKVCLQNGQPTRPLESAGFLCGTSGNSNETIHIDAKVSGNAYREIWVGYFKETSVAPLTALSEVVDSLIEIKTKNWALSRTAPGQAWLTSSEDKVFQLGEAVSLRYVGKRAVDFSWQVPSGNDDDPPEEMASVQHFSYAEQADYVPFYIKLSDSKAMGKKGMGELALYVNGQCYGAEVVQGDTVQINGYINEIPNIEQATVEFRYWDGNAKGAEQELSDYSVYNAENHVYEARAVDLGARKSFYAVSFNPKDNGSVPATTSMEANYPNPFNPETTIKYIIAKGGNVKLSIYNVKGQLVRTLVSEKQEPGYRSVIWNGKNNHGNQVSSGVYFYHLKTADKVITKKMLLMK